MRDDAYIYVHVLYTELIALSINCDDGNFTVSFGNLERSLAIAREADNVVSLIVNLFVQPILYSL